MEKRCLLCLLLVVFASLITGCAETLIVATVAPPTSTYTIVTEHKTHTFSNTSPKVQRLLLEDKRESLKIVRSTTGFQGVLYQATGWNIDSECPINELITRKIGSHLENFGVIVVSDEGISSTVHVLGGEIIIFNLDKLGGISNQCLRRVRLHNCQQMRAYQGLL